MLIERGHSYDHSGVLLMRELLCVVAVVVLAMVSAVAAQPLGKQFHSNEWAARQEAFQRKLQQTFPDAFAKPQVSAAGTVGASTYSSGGNARLGTGTR